MWRFSGFFVGKLPLADFWPTISHVRPMPPTNRISTLEYLCINNGMSWSLRVARASFWMEYSLSAETREGPPTTRTFLLRDTPVNLLGTTGHYSGFRESRSYVRTRPYDASLYSLIRLPFQLNHLFQLSCFALFCVLATFYDNVNNIQTEYIVFIFANIRYQLLLSVKRNVLILDALFDIAIRLLLIS